MWTKSGIESEGQYAISCELLRTLRFIYEVQPSERHPWKRTIDSILKSFLLDFRSITRPKEAEILFGLLRGCDYNGLAPFMSAVTANKEKIQILGFVQKNWLNRSPTDPPESQRIYEDFCQQDLKVLGVLYNDKHKEKCEFQLYDPNDIRIINETAATIQNNSLFKNQFQINSEILDSLFENSNLLSSIDEDDIGQKQLDIFQLNTRTMIMKMINYQLQNNASHFLGQLKQSNFYQGLLKFVCKESSIEMKGDIMLLEWLEQRCFAIRKYACENQQSLVKQREVHVNLIKDKIYISYQHPTLKKEKQLHGFSLKSALNFKNFEEKKEVKLIHFHDVFIAQGDQQGKAEQQIVLIDPDSLNRSNGLDIINAGIGAITYGVDLNKTVKQIFIKQRENRDKYLELASKTIFLVSEEDYRKIMMVMQSSSFKRAATMMNKGNNTQTQEEDDDNFDNIFAQELVNYGGFSQGFAKKTFGKETIEAKTETVVQLSKQLKDGILVLDEEGDKPTDDQALEDGISPSNQNISDKSKFESSKKYAEERSDTLSYLKNSFIHYMERQHSDEYRKSTKDALFDTLNNFSKNELANEYEKSMIRLFNMYCRHVFWSLIQKDDIEKIFTMVLETEQEMKSFSIFLKVLGNECFITGNKVYIMGFKAFLKKVVNVCCKNSKFTPLLSILIQDGIINAYQTYMDELKNSSQTHSEVRIEEFFKTETKAAQLINPFVIVPILQQIVNENFNIIAEHVDRLVSSLISINCLFIGNYKLKNRVWVLIISILEHVRQRAQTLPKDKVQSLLKLKVVEHLFSNFEDQSNHEKEEAQYVKRVLKENTSSEIDGTSRKEVEKLVYAKGAQIITQYLRYSNKELQSVLIEMMYKFYQVDKALHEPCFHFRNNLMNHLEVYNQLLEQGRDSKTNDYLLFYNKLDDSQRIITHRIETDAKEFDGKFRAKIQYQGAEKYLVKVDEKSHLKIGNALLLSTDKQGKNVEQLIFDSHVKKEQALKNIYSNQVYMHYPVQPSSIYTFGINEEKPVPQLIEYPIYRPLERYEETSYGKFFLTKGNKMFLWKNDELRRFKDHLDIQQFTFGKQCRVILLKNGKVIAEGRSKCRHFQDTEEEVSDVKQCEIPFYEKKDKIIQIATFFQVTIAVTEKGKVFAVGDKLAKMAKIDNTKFGFYEVPLYSEETEYLVDEPLEEPLVLPEIQPAPVVADEEQKKEEVKDAQQQQQPAEDGQKQQEEPPVDGGSGDNKQEESAQAPPPGYDEAHNVNDDDNLADMGGLFAEESAQVSPQKQKEEDNKVKKFEKKEGVHQQDEVFKYWIINGQLYCEDLASLMALQEDNQLQVQIDVIQQQVVNKGGQNEVIQIIQQQDNNQPPAEPVIQPDDIAQQQQQQPPEENKQEQQQPADDNNVPVVADNNDQEVVANNNDDQVAQQQQPADDQQQQPKDDSQPAEEQKVEDQEEEKKVEQEEPKSEQIDTDVKEDLVDRKPELKALRVWTGKTVSTNDFVYVTVVENQKTQRLELRTIGNSNFGQLGQGKDVKSSQVFRRVQTNIEPRSLNDVIIGYDHVLVISKHERVYGWGCYTQEDPQHFTPTHIPFFDNYIVHKLQSSQRTTAIVSPRSDPKKKLIIVGKFMPFAKADTYKQYDMFQDMDIYNVQPYGDKIYVSIQGTYSLNKPVQNPYVHEQKCSLCNSQIEGLLHINVNKQQPDQENRQISKFSYYCLACVQNGQVNDKVNPDYLWVIKRPIQNLEQKSFPEINVDNLYDPENRGVEQVNYLTHYKINEKEIQQTFTLEQLQEDSEIDINPIIALRTNKPLKPDFVLDLINLQDFYEQNKDNYNLSVNVTPDYGYNKDSIELIQKNQEIYDQITNSVNEIESLSTDLQKEFKSKIEEYVTKVLKDQQLYEIKYQDLKVGDDLKFRSDRLNELSDDVKKYNVGRFVQYCQYIWGAFSYITRSPQANDQLSLLKTFNQNRHKVPLMLKNLLIRKLLENMSIDDSQVSVHVNRKRAREFFDTGKADEKGDYTVFSYVMKGLQNNNYQGMRINQADKKAWFVKFIGEFALDQGGLFRESLTELCQELQSHVLNLLIPTQNQKNNHGESRDKWTINPAATSPTQMKMYEFLGALIGMSVRSGILMSLNLPSFIWKQFTHEEVTLKDLAGIDTMTVSILENLRNIQTQMDEETFLQEQGYEMFFTTILSNGEEVELMHGGRHIRVNFSNLKDYIQRTIDVRLKECKKQIKAIKKGIDKTFDSSVLRLLSWQDLEYKVVGKEVLDMERLKEITVYRNCSDSSDTIKKFWKIMNLFTNEERMLYLKFVWGRTRLPLKEEEVTENHTIQMDESADVAKLPVGRTCFFRLEIPPYKSEESFKDKLLYAIRFCTAIDADIENAVQHEEEHQHEERVDDDEDNDNRNGNRDDDEEQEPDNQGLFGDDY